jgi:two-component system chemotaxis response regulator CheY
MSAPKKLLIVDDSKVSRMLIQGFVRSLRPDWECIEAGDGNEALQLALDNIFDYATVDINMPGIDGLELTTRFYQECPQMRVCLLSANIQEHAQNRAAELKAGFVKKPITEAGIATAIAFLEGGP